jgi:predicted DsbA family dithiol-disulfide isomerase
MVVQGITMNTIPPLTVDIVSDVVCPWCYLGKRRFEHALAMTDVPVEVRWMPYQLDPTLPPEGKDRRTYMIQKFGSLERIEGAHQHLREAGKAEGIDFAFERISVSPNTLDAHRLVRWASEAGVQDAVVTDLFRAYFEEGRNIGDHEVLSETAEANGLDGQRIRERLAGSDDREAVSQEVEAARRIGVTGVPTFILGGRYAVVGAQSPEEIAEAIKGVAARLSEGAGASRDG